MRFLHMACAVTIACGMTATVGAAQYRAWGVSQANPAAHRVGFNQARPAPRTAQTVGFQMGVAGGGCECDAGAAAYGGETRGPDCGGCGDCGDCCSVPCDPWCGAGPCLLPDLVGGIVRHVGTGLHWLFCCPKCGDQYYDLRDGCGCGGCGGGAYYDAGCGAGCTGGSGSEYGPVEADHPDLMPTPGPPVQKQANPFTDDTASVYPRRSYRPTRRPAVRRATVRRATVHGAAAGETSVIRSTYAAPLPRSTSPNLAPPSRPRVKKAEILQSLKTAIQ